MTGKTLGDFAATSTRLTYGDLWTFCDSGRMRCEFAADQFERALAAVPAPSDEDAKFYRSRIVALRQRGARFVALARLIERYQRSAVIRDEIKKMAEAEAAARDGAATVEIMPEGDGDMAE